MSDKKVNQILAEFLGDCGFEPADCGGHDWEDYGGHNNSDFYRCGRCGAIMTEDWGSRHTIRFRIDTGKFDDRERTIYEDCGEKEPACTKPFNPKLVGKRGEPKDFASDPALLAKALAKAIKAKVLA